MKAAKMQIIYAAFFVFGLLACMLGWSDRSSQAQKTSAAEPEKIQQQVLSVNCKTTSDFHGRTAIKAIEFKLDSEHGFAIYDSGEKLELPKIGQAIVIASEAGINALATCERLSFLQLGEVSIIKMFESTGNPYPAEVVVFIKPKEHQLLTGSIIENDAYLEQAGKDCISNLERGGASAPYRMDKWCAVDLPQKIRRVSRTMMLEGNGHVQDFYWWVCDRSSDRGLVTERHYQVSLGEHSKLIPATIADKSLRGMGKKLKRLLIIMRQASS
jgi:hypothetical protein